ncbi:TonB-dependent receptor [Tellurirhabdus bombi]|uniref:TonB-dependent receptor n=1 Tax=Tellurirhabdus bombi TaxID=2907205 RepID=UPI001F197EA1|nr:TonB-dependent receptor [Tellurirhabdus bombi]
MQRILFLVLILVVGSTPSLRAQHIVYQGKLFDALTKEPIPGVTVLAVGTTAATMTDEQGAFRLNCPQPCESLKISHIGYKEQVLRAEAKPVLVALQPKVEDLQTVVVTASREAQARTEAPVAISRLSPVLIQETKPTNLYELINKTPGVVMANLNNEQHTMGIRQPFNTNAYFLYLEDGVPVRPMGVFNHNALIEMNVLAVSSVEVVKGPASSLYGPEAVGGAINFITHKPTVVPVVRVGILGDQWGYQRVQYGLGGMLNKRLGVYVGGFVARQRDGWQTRSDFDKISFNGRADYKFSDKTRLIGTFAYNNYDSQTGGSVDSIAFYKRQYTSTTDFTYRKVYALRSRLTLEHTWSGKSESFITAFYRDNSIKQNPNYSIRWQSGATTATGEINDNAFRSYGLIAQHSQRFSFLNSRLLVGGMFDYSPTDYYAYQTRLQALLRPDKKSVEKYTLLEELPNQFLSRYQANIHNSAVYAQFDAEPVARLRVSLGARYDRMAFDYENYLDESNGTKSYGQLTPKLGLTYDLGHSRGLYANVSRGFSPPGLTAIFRKRPVALPNGDAFYYNLQPAQFNNYEVGGWASFLSRKIYVDWAVYQMDGRNELLSIRQPDNSTDYQSVGQTRHRGVEYSLTYKPTAAWFFRFGGTNATHQFVDFALSNRQNDVLRNVNGYDMPQAPRWIANTEVTYKPRWAKGLRTSIEWQRISPWFQDQINTVRYADRGAFGARGVSVLNFRAGYEWKGFELFTNILNLSNELYANGATRGNNATDRTTFTPAAPRTFTVGLQYEWSKK